jgi:hypothetical protein
MLSQLLLLAGLFGQVHHSFQTDMQQNKLRLAPSLRWQFSRNDFVTLCAF